MACRRRDQLRNLQNVLLLQQPAKPAAVPGDRSSCYPAENSRSDASVQPSLRAR
jgi:hypothetical protein